MEALYINDYTWKWDDRGTGSNSDGSFWQPNEDYFNLDSPKRGFERVGDSAVPHYYSNHNNILLLRQKGGGTGGAIKDPIDYKLIWKDFGAGANADGSFWHPVCPGGYVPLGSVAQRGYNKPYTWEYVCVSV